MKIEELQTLVNELGKAYNHVVEGIQAHVTADITADEALGVIGMKTGAEMTAAFMLHTLLHCYGQQADMELGDSIYHLGGDKLTSEPVKPAGKEGGNEVDG